MKTIPAHLLSQISGGVAVALGSASASASDGGAWFDSWGGDGGGGGGGGGFDSWGGGSSFGSGGIDFGSSVGSSFDRAGIDFGTSVTSGVESAWEDGGGFESTAGAGSWSLEAIGIEGGEMAVVRITAADAPGIPIFDNTQPVASYGPGEAPGEGQYLGQWVEPAPLSYAHTAFDGALIANTGRLAGAAGAAFIEGALTGGGIGAVTANPIAVVGGLVIGGLVASGTYFLLQDDHPGGHFESAPPKLGSNEANQP